MKDYFGNFVCIFLLDISGYVDRKKCVLNLIQRDLLLSLTTIGSILGFVILTFWELILGFWALFHIFLEWGSIRKQFNSLSCRLITFVF